MGGQGDEDRSGEDRLAAAVEAAVRSTGPPRRPVALPLPNAVERAAFSKVRDVLNSRSRKCKRDVVDATPPYGLSFLPCRCIDHHPFTVRKERKWSKMVEWSFSSFEGAFLPGNGDIGLWVKLFLCIERKPTHYFSFLRRVIHVFSIDAIFAIENWHVHKIGYQIVVGWGTTEVAEIFT